MILFRLTLGLAMLLSGSICVGQTGTTQTEPRREVLVFGDVAKPAVYALPTPKTVSEMLGPNAAGGLTCKSANVRIVRFGANGPEVAWGAVVTAGQPCEQKVYSSDIMVFHDLDRLSGASTKPITIAVINPQMAPLFATLDGGATASAVLADDKLQFSGRDFRIIRTNPKAVPVAPGEDAVLMHGDILMVAGAPEVTPSEIRTVSQETPIAPQLPGGNPTSGPSLVPVSQQAPVVPPDPGPQDMAFDDVEPIPAVANYGAVDAGLPPVPPGMQQPVPQPQASGLTPPSPPSVPNATTNQFSPTEQQDPLSIDPFGPTAQIQPPVGSTPAGLQPAGPAGQSYNTGFRGSQSPGLPGFGNPMPGSETAPANGSNPENTSDTASSLPLPSDLDAVVRDDSSNATMWYVAGLGGALLVVLGAWAYGSRMIAETPQVDQSQYKRPVSKRVSQTIKHPPVAEQSRPAPAATTTNKPAMPKIKPIAAATPTTPQPKPVAPAAPAAVPPPAPAPAPLVAQGPTPATPVAAAPPMPAPAPQLSPVVPVAPSVPQPPMPAAPIVSQQPPTSSFTPISIPVSQPVPQPVAPTPVMPTPMASVPIQPAPLPVQKPEPIPVPDTSTTRLLDALINNSIPITEQPVQLPSQTEYYGDSNGPQHLRLDPPQTQLRGHHLGSRAGQRQTTTHSQNSYQQ